MISYFDNNIRLLKKKFTKSVFKFNCSYNEHVPLELVQSFVINKLGVSLKRNRVLRKSYDNENKQIELYLAKYDEKESVFKVKYNLPEHKWGRIFPEKSLSLCVFHRPTRHAFCKGSYIDIDMKNAHPNIVKNICLLNNISCPTIEKYCNDRDAFLKLVCDYHNVDEVEAKTLMLRLTYGGEYANWITKIEVQQQQWTIEPLVDIVEYEKEMEIIRDIVFEKNTHIIADVEKADPAIFKNPKYKTAEDVLKKKKKTCMSHFCNTIERYLQEACIKYLVDEKDFILQDIVPCQDGFMILFDLWYDGILKDLEKVMFDAIGFNMVLVVKQFDEAIDIPVVYKDNVEPKNEVEPENEKYRFVSDDNNASILILNEIKDNLVYVERRLFLKHNNIWIEDSDFINNFILDYILKSNICKKNEDKKYVPYNQNVKCAKNVREALLVKIKTQENLQYKNLYEKFHTTTRNRLCFLDGVLDFKAKKFYKWEEIDFEYYTTQQIKRNYYDYFCNPNKVVIADLLKKIFTPLFDKDVDIALHFLSRAITGNYVDKNFATYVGNRNCGKGVVFDLIAFAFENYVRTFELGNILHERTTDTKEISRKLYWLLDFEFTRLAISQETPAADSLLKADGKMIKKLAGGGDVMVARRNYDRVDTNFKIDTTFMFMGNDELQIDVADCYEQCVSFVSVNAFKSQEDIDAMRENGEDERVVSSYLIKDPNIKNQCKTEEWGNAMVYLLYENFKDSAVVPNYLKNNSDEVEFMSIRKKIIASYEITKNNSDEILCDDVYRMVNDNKKKTIKELEKLGVNKTKSNKKETRNKQVFIGLKVREQDDETDEEIEEV
jgi:hypothetical protein